MKSAQTNYYINHDWLPFGSVLSWLWFIVADRFLVREAGNQPFDNGTMKAIKLKANTVANTPRPISPKVWSFTFCSMLPETNVEYLHACWIIIFNPTNRHFFEEIVK